MKFKKGKSGNPSGKPKGTKNTKTLEWEEFGKMLLSVGADRAKIILTSCEDDDFMKYYIQLVEYFAPKQSRIESTNVNDTNINVSVQWENEEFTNSITETASASIISSTRS